MEIRGITQRHVQTLLGLVEKEYELVLQLHGTFTAQQREHQVEQLEELTYIRDALKAALRDGGNEDFGWVPVE